MSHYNLDFCLFKDNKEQVNIIFCVNQEYETNAVNWAWNIPLICQYLLTAKISRLPDRGAEVMYL